MLDSPGTLLMNIDGPTAHAIQVSGEDDGFFVPSSYGRSSPDYNSLGDGVYRIESLGYTGGIWNAAASYGMIFIINEKFNFRSPRPYVDDHPYFIMSDGNVNGVNLVVFGFCGRKYFVTLRLPTQLETVYFMLKLMEEVI